MGRGRSGLITQSHAKEKKEKAAARKGEITYCFHKQKPKKDKTIVSEDFIKELKKCTKKY